MDAAKHALLGRDISIDQGNMFLFAIGIFKSMNLKVAKLRWQL